MCLRALFPRGACGHFQCGNRAKYALQCGHRKATACDGSQRKGIIGAPDIMRKARHRGNHARWMSKKRQHHAICSGILIGQNAERMIFLQFFQRSAGAIVFGNHLQAAMFAHLQNMLLHSFVGSRTRHYRNRKRLRELRHPSFPSCPDVPSVKSRRALFPARRRYVLHRPTSAYSLISCGVAEAMRMNSKSVMDAFCTLRRAICRAATSFNSGKARRTLLVAT